MSHRAAKAQAEADNLLETALQLAEQAIADPTPFNRLSQVEAAMSALLAQYRVLASTADAQTEAVIKRLPIGAYTALEGVRCARVLSSGVGYLTGTDIVIEVDTRFSVRISLHPEVRCVLAAREDPFTAASFCGVDAIREVYLTEVQRAGEVYVADHFEHGQDSYTLEFSFASLGGNLQSPVRVCWSLSRVGR